MLRDAWTIGIAQYPTPWRSCKLTYMLLDMQRLHARYMRVLVAMRIMAIPLQPYGYRTEFELIDPH
jgi:hypothetical protein